MQSKSDNPRRVLVVDDDPGILRFIEMLLQDEGYLVDTATDGVDALARASADPPDLIVLDIAMPRMDGRTVARTLRERGASAPVILMSAGYDAAREAALLGVEGHLAKPFSAGSILETINGILASRA